MWHCWGTSQEAGFSHARLLFQGLGFRINPKPEDEPKNPKPARLLPYSLDLSSGPLQPACPGHSRLHLDFGAHARMPIGGLAETGFLPRC